MWPQADIARFRSHAARGIIVDTNLLVIYLVGLHDRKKVEHFLPGSRKGEIVCFPKDFDILKSLFIKLSAKKFIVTPSILAELSNLTFDKFQDPSLHNYFRSTLAFIKMAEEKHTPKTDLLATYHLPVLGFSDSSIVETAKIEDCLVLTQDLKCATILEKEGCCVFNMNHLRTLTL
jgi:rRNA-processing protein FCF1